jgi:uncharacterized protein YecT (DUF1311 family)
MRSAILAFGLAIIGAAASAQDQSKQGNCYDTAMAQTEINRCASSLAHEADTKLNDTYKRLMSAAAKDPVALAKFRAFENAWIKYRDSYLEAAFPSGDKRATYGSMFPADFNELRRKLTEDQTKVLQQMLSDYLGDQSSLSDGPLNKK